jgi:hypothetical protein
MAPASRTFHYLWQSNFTFLSRISLIVSVDCRGSFYLSLGQLQINGLGTSNENWRGGCLNLRVPRLHLSQLPRHWPTRVNPPVISPAAMGQLLKPTSVQDVEAWLAFNATDGQFENQPYVFSIPNDW